jgi:hypothetical protein
MKVTYLPVLHTLRELYLQPREMNRFKAYLGALTGGGEDVVLPIGVANPMAKEHALACIEELLALDADQIGRQAAGLADARLARVTNPVEIKAAVVLADDVGGGWTNRYTTEASVRFPGRGALKRPFATALVWTSEAPSAEQVHVEVLAAIYRVAYQQQHGLPTSLESMLDQEGLAGIFAEARIGLPADVLDRAAAIIHSLESTNAPYPRTFACMYGDEAAQQLGYEPLGLPARSGFEVALADALERQRDPIRALLVQRTPRADKEAQGTR